MALLILQAIVLLGGLLYLVGVGMGILFGAPYVGTGKTIGVAMLELADVSVNDVVMDLGCGLGNILYAALAQKQVRRVIGYDINPLLILGCRIRFWQMRTKSEFHTKAIEQMAAHPEVSVVTLYLLPPLMNRIVPILVEKLPKTTRIVVHGFAFEGIEPLKTQHIHNATLRLYAMNDLIAAHKL